MSERNYGLDIARCVAMCGIIVLHILGHGGVLSVLELGTVKYWIVWWIEILAFCSVDLFALLSGYLGIYSKRKSCYRVLELVAVLVVYCFVITGVCRAFSVGSFSGVNEYIMDFFPYVFGEYWYIVCYIPVGLLQPYINKMLLSLTEKQHRSICLIGIILLGLIPVALKKDIFIVKRGYSFVWLLVCYVIGAYWKRNQNKGISRKVALLTYFGCSLCLLLGNYVLYIIRGVNTQYFIAYNSPIVLVMAIMLLEVFSIMKNVSLKMIPSFAGIAFDVYIIHCHILIFDYIIKNRFEFIATYPSLGIVISVSVIAILAFLVLSAVGFFRTFLFEKCGINVIIRKITLVLDQLLYYDL